MITLSYLESVIIESKKYKPSCKEKNIFSIGGRGHYENPISEILSFFLDPNECHGFKDLILSALNYACKIDPCHNCLVEPPRREKGTDHGRIDIVLIGSDFVTVIENKIRHSLNNPFDDYEKYINQNYSGKKINKVLLSVSKENTVNGWISVSYSLFIENVKKNISEYIFANQYSKWLVLLREFILNIEQECGMNSMNIEEFKFIKNNYHQICNLILLKGEFIDEILLRCTNEIQNECTNLSSKKEIWSKVGQVLRFQDKKWEKNSSVVFIILDNGFFRIQLYLYGATSDQYLSIKSFLTEFELKEEWLEHGIYQGFMLSDNADLDSAIKNLCKIYNAINMIYFSYFF